MGQGALPEGFPPLRFIGDAQKTLTGSEPDLGRLIAAVYGLQPEIVNATWDNLFVGIDSGKTDVGLSNITDTETRWHARWRPGQASSSSSSSSLPTANPGPTGGRRR